MDIQGYILDHWMGKMSAEHPVLMVYDKEGIYYDLLPMLKDRDVKVIDTTHMPDCRHNAFGVRNYP